MSRWVFFYALNSKQGKEELYDDLTSATKYEKSFADFIAERTAKWGGNFSVTYEQVITSVKNHFEDLLPSHLREIVRWYEDMFYRQFCGTTLYEWKQYDIAVESTLRRCGIETLFEITSSSASCYGFMFQYGNFEDLFELDASDEEIDQGSNIKSYDFIRFLDYMILLMLQIHEANLEHHFDYADLPENHQKEIENIKANYQNNTKLKELLQRELKYIKEQWTEYQQNDDRPDPEAQTVHDHSTFLRACLEMKSIIKEEHTRVLMVNG